MRVYYNKFFSLIGMCFVCIFGCLYPLHSEAEELPPGIVIGDSEGLHATKNGEYHVNVNDVLPGKKWHKSISIVNMEKDIPYQVTMLITPPVVSGSLDLSKAIQMTLVYEGKSVYKGPASGISKELNLQTTPLNLGIFNAGDSRALEVEYSLSGTYTNQDFVQKNVMDNVWTYYAVKTTTPIEPIDPTKPKKAKPIGRLPSTGEIKQYMVIFCLGLFLILIILLIWKNKQVESNKSKEEGWKNE